MTTKVGDLRRSCFGSPALAATLGPPPISVDTIRTIPFVLPVYNENGVYVPVDDGCPLTPGQRTPGHEAPTMSLALEIASVTQQLVFGPQVAAHRYLADGRMIELEIEGWNQSDPVFVACNVDRVRATQQRQITDVVRGALDQLARVNRA